MGRIPVIVLLDILSGVLPLIAGLLLWKKLSRPMRLLVILLIYGLLNSVVLVVLALQNINNIFLLHLYTLASYLLIALLFSYWLSRLPSKLVRLSIPAFFSLYIILILLGYEDLTLPNVHSRSIRSILIAGITLYTLYFSLRDHIDYPVYQDERFWISIGTFISYSGTALVYAAIPVHITKALWLIHSFLAIMGNFFYLIGYLCLRK